MEVMILPSPKAAQSAEKADHRTLLWAGIRLALGTAQITGASAGLVLLCRTGASKATVITVAITGGYTVISRLLFRGRPAPDSRDE